MEILRKVLQKKLLFILAPVIILPLCISCNQVQTAGESDIPVSEFVDFSSLPEEGLLLVRSVLLLDDEIEESEFCAIGERTITYAGPDEANYRISRTEGKVKINSIVYGNPGTDEVPFFHLSGRGILGHFPWDRASFRCASTVIPISVEPEKPPFTTIIFGTEKGKDCKIIAGVWTNDLVISIQAIKKIKELSLLSPEEYRKQRDELLLKSNNQELLSYIFRKDIFVDRGNSVIKALANEGIKTPERKWLAYGWSLRWLYYTPLTNAKNDSDWGDKDDERKFWIATVTKQFSEISSAHEGIKYLRLLGLFTYESPRIPVEKDYWEKYCESPGPVKSILLEKMPLLRDKLKQITDDLSKKFKNEKAYPEWEKWVNKIFPPASLSGGTETPK